MTGALVPVERIERAILLVRGHKVMLDADLALRAVQVNIQIMRAFVKLRQWLATHQDLARKLDALERKYDQQSKVVFDAIRELMAPARPAPRRRIGFSTGGKS